MNQRDENQGHEHPENWRESERWNNGFERSAGRSQDARRERGWEDHHRREPPRYGRDYYGPPRTQQDPYSLADRARWRDQPHEHSSSEEMFGRRPFSAPEEPQYYGTGSVGWGGPGFTGGAYAYGNGPRDQERQIDSEYSDESAVSYEQQQGYGRYPTSRGRQYAGSPQGRGQYGSGQYGSGQYGSGQYGAGPAQRSHYGVGPKGYQRSDERLKEDISERLTEAHHIDASDVTVEVRAAKVVLEGTVPSRHMKHAIEDLADACPGVQDVDNRVRVASRDELARRALQPQSSVQTTTPGVVPNVTKSRQ